MGTPTQRQRDDPPPPLVLLFGFTLGCAFSSDGGGGAVGVVCALKSFVNSVLVPLYILASLVYLLRLSKRHGGSRRLRGGRSIHEGSLSVPRFWKRLLPGGGGGRDAPELIKEKPTHDRQAASASAPPPPRAVAVGPADRGEAPPVNLTGTYKLVENRGFVEFLSALGVPWALRKAADGARPTHTLTHEGRTLRIRITGIITAETTYTIGGDPVETCIRGRMFHDTVSYLKSGDGVRVHKVAQEKEHGTIIVTRRLTPDRKEMIMRSRAIFDDGRESVEAIQTFRRVQ